MVVHRPKRKTLNPLDPLELPPSPPGGGGGIINPGNSQIVQNAFARANARRAAAREGRPIQVSDPEIEGILGTRPSGNTRGPRPGQGRNQGAGVPDVADRSGQGDARSGISGVGRAANTSATLVQPFFSGIGSSLEMAPIPNTKITPRPLFDDAVKVSDGTKPPPGPFGGVDDEPPVGPPPSPPGTDPTDVGSLQPFIDQTNAIAGQIRSGQFDETFASQFIDPVTGETRIQMPTYQGQEVFYGRDLFGNDGFGILARQEDEEGNVFETFQLVPGAIQNRAQFVSDLIDASRAFFIDTDAATRQFLIDQVTIKAQQIFDENQLLSRFEQETSERIAGQEFATGERIAGQEFAAEEGERDRQMQEFLTRLNDDLGRQRDELNNAFTAQQNNIDRALQFARDDRDFALRSADFELARRRFQQETQLANAQFALSLFQSLSANPEMLFALQNSGALGQFQQMLPGLNIGALIPPLVEGGEAESRLAQVELPALRELQRLPADAQTQIITSLAVRTGVRRETILAEIQRRASGQGLGSSSIQRLPA